MMPSEPKETYKHCASLFELGGGACHYLFFILYVWAYHKPIELLNFLLMCQALKLYLAYSSPSGVCMGLGKAPMY